MMVNFNLPTTEGVRRRVRERADATKVAFSSVDGFKKALLVEDSEGFSSNGSMWAWSNKHMDPTPLHERTWRWYNFAMVWIAYSFSTGVWTLGSSMIAAGLTAGQAVACVFIAHLLGAIAIVINSRFGACYHIGYPVYQRLSFGPFGSFFPILLRCATGIIWCGVQNYQGGRFVSLALRCIFGHRWSDIPNTIPVSSAITTQNLAATLIFCVLTLPALFMDVHKTRWLWTLKTFLVPPAVLGLFIYTQTLAKGNVDTFTTVKHYNGPVLAWTMLKYINSAMGKTSPSQVNQPDLARYATTRGAPQLSQLLTLPIFNTGVACLGIFATSSVYTSSSKLIWNPWDLCSWILDEHWQASTRFAILLVSLAWGLSIFVSNQAANCIPFGADITALLPKVLNINRGMILAYALGLAICPWYILASATSFLTFLGSYSVLLGPVVGVSGADYFWRKGNVHVPSLYTGSKDGQYFYGCGVNWRAFAAFVVGCGPTMPGFMDAFGYSVPTSLVHLFYVGWLFSITVSAFVYILICVFFPPDNLAAARAAKFEEFADQQHDLLDRVGLPVHGAVDGDKNVKEGEVDVAVEEVRYQQ